MPAKLGLTAAGGIASALGGSGKAGPTSQSASTSTNTGNNTTSSLQSGTSTPSLNPTLGAFQNSLVPALSSLYAQAQAPVYGKQQIAQVANQGDAATTAASNALSANLARRGVLDSGAQAAGQTQLQQNNESNTVGFENQIPLLNYQQQQANTQNVLGLAENLTGKALSTNVQTGTNTGSNTSFGQSSGTQQASGPAFASGLLGSLGNGLTSAGGAGKGGGKVTPTTLGNSLPGGIGSNNPGQLLNSLNPLNDLSDLGY